MNHEESKLQQQCVAWFRMQYPQYAMLLTHPANEGNGNRVTGAIHKAEGTVPGIPDLLLFLPSFSQGALMAGLGIEMKTAKGRLSQSQKDFCLMFSAAHYDYVVVRSLDDFRQVVSQWVNAVPKTVSDSVSTVHKGLQQEALRRDRDKLQRIVRSAGKDAKF